MENLVDLSGWGGGHLLCSTRLTWNDPSTSFWPEVHAKGTDDTVETVLEREVVKAYGGQTVICGYSKDDATTDVIATIVDRPGGT